MTTWATDDLAQVIIAPEREFAGFAQGIIREWDPDTFENVVEVRGGTLTNLPVKGGVEALTFQTGQVVMLSRWKLRSGKGAATYWIDGAALAPGAGRAEESVAFLRSGLAKQISAAVFAERIDSATELGSVTDPGSSYIASDGPSITGVDISDTGRCLVLITGRIQTGINNNSTSAQAWMSFAISGASSVAPNDEQSLNQFLFGPLTEVIATTSQGTRLVLVEGLNPGTHTIAARYRSVVTGNGDAIISSRNISVIAF